MSRRGQLASHERDVSIRGTARIDDNARPVSSRGLHCERRGPKTGAAGQASRLENMVIARTPAGFPDSASRSAHRRRHIVAEECGECMRTLRAEPGTGPWHVRNALCNGSIIRWYVSASPFEWRVIGLYASMCRPHRLTSKSTVHAPQTPAAAPCVPSVRDPGV